MQMPEFRLGLRCRKARASRSQATACMGPRNRIARAQRSSCTEHVRFLWFRGLQRSMDPPGMLPIGMTGSHSLPGMMGPAGQPLVVEGVKAAGEATGAGSCTPPCVCTVSSAQCSTQTQLSNAPRTPTLKVLCDCWLVPDNAAAFAAHRLLGQTQLSCLAAERKGLR